jgi:GTP-binding protein
MSRIVAIVGRPNVGKSTLFNRLVESREAIVDEISGVTRDRNYGRATWNGIDFSVIDTGGYVENSDDIFEEEINKQVKLAIDESDVIMFLVDAGTGILDLDRSVASMLRRSKKEVVLVVNKTDNPERQLAANEFYELGLGDYFTISSANGSGTGELLDEVVKKLPEAEERQEEDLPVVAVVGRPNVGKSSLVNSLIGESRNIVTPLAGTTRDSILIKYDKYNHKFLLIDTAGLRKKTKVAEDLEFYSTLRAVKAVENSDVCLLMLDATRGLEAQDMNIFSLIVRNNKGLIVLVNKWDLITKETNTIRDFEKELRGRTAPFTDYPILFISATEKQRIFNILDTIAQVNANRTKKISTSVLNEVMGEIIAKNPPPSIKGKYVKIKYITQLPLHYPAFAFFCNLPQYVKDPYRRFLENKMRTRFDFTGTPVTIFFRQK